MAALPLDALAAILRTARLTDVLTICATSRNARRLCSPEFDVPLWRDLVDRDFGPASTLSLGEYNAQRGAGYRSWYEAYMAQARPPAAVFGPDDLGRLDKLLFFGPWQREDPIGSTRVRRDIFLGKGAKRESVGYQEYNSGNPHRWWGAAPRLFEMFGVRLNPAQREDFGKFSRTRSTGTSRISKEESVETIRRKIAGRLRAQEERAARSRQIRAEREQVAAQDLHLTGDEVWAIRNRLQILEGALPHQQAEYERKLRLLGLDTPRFFGV